MAYTLDPRVYGPEYEYLLRTAHATNGEFIVPMPSYKHAMALKTKVYSYFRALRRNPPEGSDLPTLADAMSLTVRGESLVLYPREDSWDHAALRAALGVQKGFAGIGGVLPQIVGDKRNPHLEKLYEIRLQREFDENK